LSIKEDVGNILVTCIKVIPELLNDYPTASFSFIGSRTIIKRKVEGYSKTQRFNVYKDLTENKIGDSTFTHFEYPSISGYLLLNNIAFQADPNLEDKIKDMFSRTYTHIHDV